MVSANYNDNIDPPVSVTDGSVYGTPYNVTHTLRYNANAGLQLQMPLYNQTLYTTLSIARTMVEWNRLSYEKAEGRSLSCKSAKCIIWDKLLQSKLYW